MTAWSCGDIRIIRRLQSRLACDSLKADVIGHPCGDGIMPGDVCKAMANRAYGRRYRPMVARMGTQLVFPPYVHVCASAGL